MMIKKSLAIVALALLSATACSAANDFDKVCGYFERLQTETASTQLSETERADFISGLVQKELDPDSPARAAWEVVVYAVPEVRYELFKTSAEEATKGKWQCEAMKALVPSTGK